MAKSAGTQDWFQMDSNLATKPEVRRIIRLSGAPVDAVVGRLSLFWAQVDQHGDLIDEHQRPEDRPDLDGIIPDYTVEDLLDVCGGDEDFWHAVESTGWLCLTESGILIPGFERRFSECSKRRASAARRQQRKRMRDAGVIGTRPASRAGVTSVTPQRDQRRGEESTGEDRKIPSPLETRAPVSNDETDGDGEGKDLRPKKAALPWQQLVDTPDALVRAVTNRNVPFFKTMWGEAAKAGWVEVTDRERLFHFLQSAWYVTHPPDSMPIENAARVWRDKVIEDPGRTIRTGRMDDRDSDWAREMLRLFEGRTRDSTSNLDQSGPSKEEMAARLREHIANKSRDPLTA